MRVKETAIFSAARIETQTQLQRLSTGAATAAERSVAANLLGVMAITTTATNKARGSRGFLAMRVRLPARRHRKPGELGSEGDLELVLRLKRPGKSHFGTDAHGGFGFGGSEGASPEGGGF